MGLWISSLLQGDVLVLPAAGSQVQCPLLGFDRGELVIIDELDEAGAVIPGNEGPVVESSEGLCGAVLAGSASTGDACVG